MNKLVFQFTQRAALLAGGVAFSTLALLIAEPARAIRITFDESSVIDTLNLNPDGPDDVEVITDQWASYGLSMSATDKSGEHEKNLVLFNSNCNPNLSKTNLLGCKGGDRDLATGTGSYTKGDWTIGYKTPEQGNVLIIQEHALDSNKSWKNDVFQTDDDARGGWINFDFDTAINFDKLGFVDLDDAGVPEFKFTFADGTTQIIENLLDSDPRVSIIGSSSKFESDDSENVVQENGENSLREYSFYLENVTQASVKLPSSGAVAYLEYNQVEVPEPLTLAGLGVVTGSLLLYRRRKLS